MSISEYLESMIVKGARCEILREFGPQVSSHDSRRCKSFILEMPRTMKDQIVDFPPARYQKEREWFGIVSRTRNRLIEPIDFERLYSRCARLFPVFNCLLHLLLEPQSSHLSGHSLSHLQSCLIVSMMCYQG